MMLAQVMLLTALVAVSSVDVGATPRHDGQEHSSTAECDAVADVVVWGGTVCGLTASLAAAGQNVSVLWLVNGSRLGGPQTFACFHAVTLSALSQ